MIEFIADRDHYDKVLKRATQAMENLWIGTADIKDLYITDNNSERPFLGILADMIKRGVNVRLLHAKEPGPNFHADFDRHPILVHQLERSLCARVHFKIIVIDQHYCYIGSANLTGAGIGMKGNERRNFEAGIFTDETPLVDAAIEEFDKVWRGSQCRKCQRRQYCADPIA